MTGPTLAEQVASTDANGVSPSIECHVDNTACNYQEPHDHGFACDKACPCNRGGHS